MSPQNHVHECAQQHYSLEQNAETNPSVLQLTVKREGVPVHATAWTEPEHMQSGRRQPQVTGRDSVPRLSRAGECRDRKQAGRGEWGVLPGAVLLGMTTF